MSRWGTLFASLSKHSIDTIPPAGGEAGEVCVDCVDCVPIESGENGGRQRASADPAAPPADGWLRHLAAAIAAALADGAEREADPDGWLRLIRPDGRRSVTAPHVAAQLSAAGLLPPLPEARETVEAAACARPTAWCEIEDEPREGDRCGCGSRLWWVEPQALTGWACATCHPPEHLPAEAVRLVRT
ncbi:hypothetical protein GXW74_17135 [Roseomonas eburnea]|uniref:Uncharacterized protein n=1 Tax=Neoroseomonas eburnea TaxID=1346889 RepID=A0A9X9XET2_9PROT|nr:hypothetical protein [Neoroseomonas eburnea]MBR0682218.1 hypothetical protein [Neoroseomonas eburnea]